MKRALILTLALGAVIAFTFVVMPKVTARGSSASYPYPPAYPTADFELKPVQSVQVVLPEETADFLLYLKPVNRFQEAVSLSAQDVPTAAHSYFDPIQVVPPGYSTLSLTPSTLTPTGTHPFIVTGAGGGQEHVAALALVVLPEASDSASAGSGQPGQLEIGGTAGVTMTIDVPGQAFSQTTTITLTLLGQTDTPGGAPPAGQAYVRAFRVAASAPLVAGQFITLTMHYQQGETEQLDEGSLRVLYWDPSNQSWQRDGDPSLSIDVTANVFTARVNRLGEHAVTGFIATERIYLPMVIR